MKRLLARALFLSAAALGIGQPVAASSPGIAESPLAAQPVAVLNTNGAWCWFQGPRAIITASGDLLVGSTPSTGGTDGAARAGAVEVTAADVSTLVVDHVDQLAGAGRYRSDDHVSPSLAELPSGRIVAAWAGHNDDTATQTATLDPSDAAWSINPMVQAKTSTTYSNLVSLSAENGGRGRLYNFYRGEDQGVNAMVSDDAGRTWRPGGLLVENTPKHPYTRFTTNGTDRIDFISATGNPGAANGSSVRSGYLKGGRIYATDGRRIGTLGTGVDWSQLFPVDAGTPGKREGLDTDVWTADMAMADGKPVALLTVKHPQAPAVPGRSFTQEYRYARWTGTTWRVARVAWGGSELYDVQHAYSGNLTFDQSDPSRVFLSSNVDPQTGGRLDSAADGRPHWEIYEATTSDGGAAWTIRSVTSDSAVDNLRPVHASGSGRRALVWLRGTYRTFRDYDLDVVGVPDPKQAAAAPAVVRRSRVPRSAAAASGRWTGTASDGLFSVSSNLQGSGFLLPSGRGRQRAFISVPVAQRTKPVAVDRNGDGRDEVLLIDPTGKGRHRIVALRPTGQVTTEVLAGPPGTTPVVGDFDGDGGDDIVWYAPGPAPDLLSRSAGPQRQVPASGFFRPAVGDFDGDDHDDIIWHAPGPAKDAIWWGRDNGGFTSSTVSVSGSYRPLAVDANGDGRDDIVWQSGGRSAPSHLWTSRGRTFSSRVWGPASTPAVRGDFDGDRRDDLFFDRGGDAADGWWWSSRP